MSEGQERKPGRQERGDDEEQAPGHVHSWRAEPGREPVDDPDLLPDAEHVNRVEVVVQTASPSGSASSAERTPELVSASWDGKLGDPGLRLRLLASRGDTIGVEVVKGRAPVESRTLIYVARRGAYELTRREVWTGSFSLLPAL